MRVTDEAAKRLKTSHKKITEKSSVAHVLNTLVESAVNSGATDIHIEPRDSFMQVRYRVNGALYQSDPLPKKVQDPLTSYIKILAGLKVDESSAPQHGQLKVESNENVYNLSVALLPISEGEKIVIRILRDSLLPQNLGELGLWGKNLEHVHDAVMQSKGLILATGPARSGKTTTLFSILSLLNNSATNIATIENPIEHKIENANQTQLNQKAGITAASALKALLKQDPNVIMISELDSTESADAAIQAALSGRLLLSTLHGANSVNSLQRLVSLSAEPYLVASTVRIVINQRLVRRLCNECRIVESLSVSEATALKKRCHISSTAEFQKLHTLAKEFQKSTGAEDASETTITSTTIKKIYKVSKNGCDSCSGTGYHERIGIFEVLENTLDVQNSVLNGGSAQQLQAVADKNGMASITHDGLAKALAGLTAIDDVLQAVG